MVLTPHQRQVLERNLPILEEGIMDGEILAVLKKLLGGLSMETVRKEANLPGSQIRSIGAYLAGLADGLYLQE